MSMHADFGYEDGEVIEYGDWENDDFFTEESEQEARDRMTPDELQIDLAFDPFAVEG